MRIALALALSAIALPAAAQVPQVTMNTDAQVVGIAVNETVESRPDLAVFQVGVSSTAATATAALAENARKMDNIIARIRANGVADRDIQTTGISLYPQHNNPVRQPNGSYSQPRIVGYNASNGVSVRYRRLDQVGSLIDALVAAGANNINGPSFTIEDPAARVRQARDQAIETAQARAGDYARKLGARGARLLSITEGAQGRMYGQDRFMRTMDAMAVSAEAAPPPPPVSPIAPGEIGTTVSMFIQFALER